MLTRCERFSNVICFSNELIPIYAIFFLNKLFSSSGTHSCTCLKSQVSVIEKKRNCFILTVCTWIMQCELANYILILESSIDCSTYATRWTNIQKFTLTSTNNAQNTYAKRTRNSEYLIEHLDFEIALYSLNPDYVHETCVVVMMLLQNTLHLNDSFVFDLNKTISRSCNIFYKWFYFIKSYIYYIVGFLVKVSKSIFFV